MGGQKDYRGGEEAYSQGLGNGSTKLVAVKWIASPASIVCCTSVLRMA
jgi:hypothetical protein